ncbi:hypothetical protein [Streptomyces sp. NPDC048659]|uniref:hypothetical protein n=1 Tax=Streptomyces sp. NPDC048659 TaxID=3155489 RepID=UPI0034196D36
MTHPRPLLCSTRHLRRGERLLHGKGTASAVGAGRAADWVELDSDVHAGTWPRVGGWRSSSRFRLGAHWFDSREVADWDTAPYWDEEAGAPDWGRPPTPSELALGLCHADPRVRAAALDEAGPAAPLPLLLLRCADSEDPVRERARAAFAPALDTADDASVRSLTALALRLALRRHGPWARDLVLARTGDGQADAVRELLAGEGPDRRTARRAGIRAGAESGVLDQEALFGMALTEREPAQRIEALRCALAGRRDAVTLRRFLGLLDACEGAEFRVVALRHALGAGLLSADDLAALALRHRDRRVRRLAARVLPGLPGAGTALDSLPDAFDGVVRGSAVERLRAAGRADDLVPHLADPSSRIRGLARLGVREAGGDPGARLRALCSDPATVTPAAVSGLAEERRPEDAPLLRTLVRHPDGAVRARALGGLRMLGALDDTALPPHADDPDPRVGAVVLGALRDDPAALRGLLGHPHARVRARALALLSDRHGLGWDEALPHLGDPAPEVARAARGALRAAAREVTTARLIAYAAPGGAPALRALAMELLDGRYGPEVLLNALRLRDDPQREVRVAAREQATRVVWDREAREGPHGAEISALAEADAERIRAWRAERVRRKRAARPWHSPPGGACAAHSGPASC